MRRFIKSASVLLVALWLPATLHCQLENLGLDALFACASQLDESTHNDGTGCADDGCRTIEAGQFALAKSRIVPAILPSLVCPGTPCFLTIAPPAPVREIFAFHQTETLPLQRTWQFARRAALPARAPDVLNT